MEKFISTREFGPMSGGKAFYDESMSKEEIEKDLLERRKKLGNYYGFDGTKILVPYQNPSLYESGHYEDVTEQISDKLNEDAEFDLWNLDIPCDVMLIRSNLTGVVLAYPVADCPVVIASTKDIIALAHCGAKEINRMVPLSVIDAVRNITDAKSSDIDVYVGPCANEKSYIYETYPNWATESFWNKYIKETANGYHIDMRSAVLKQLIDTGVHRVHMNMEDTITSPEYYSHYAKCHGQEDKNGRFLVGAFHEGKIKKIGHKNK